MKSSSYYKDNRKFGKKSSGNLTDFIYQLIFGFLIFFIGLWIYKIYDSCDFLKDTVENIKEYEENRRQEKMTRIIKRIEESYKKQCERNKK